LKRWRRWKDSFFLPEGGKVGIPNSARAGRQFQSWEKGGPSLFATRVAHVARD